MPHVPVVADVLSVIRGDYNDRLLQQIAGGQGLHQLRNGPAQTRQFAVIQAAQDAKLLLSEGLGVHVEVGPPLARRPRNGLAVPLLIEKRFGQLASGSVRRMCLDVIQEDEEALALAEGIQERLRHEICGVLAFCRPLHLAASLRHLEIGLKTLVKVALG